MVCSIDFVLRNIMSDCRTLPKNLSGFTWYIYTHWILIYAFKASGDHCILSLFPFSNKLRGGAAASFACRSLSEAERCTWFFSLSVLNAFFLYIHMYTYVCIYSRHTNRYTYIYKYILLCIYTQIVRWFWILAVSQTLSKNFFSIFCSFFFQIAFSGLFIPPPRPLARRCVNTI